MRVLTVPKNYLMLIAGLVWCLAGAMVIRVGLPLLLGLAPAHLILFPLAVAIFLAFYFLVFSRLVRKHTGRIRARLKELMLKRILIREGRDSRRSFLERLAGPLLPGSFLL